MIVTTVTVLRTVYEKDGEGCGDIQCAYKECGMLPSATQASKMQSFPRFLMTQHGEPCSASSGAALGHMASYLRSSRQLLL